RHALTACSTLPRGQIDAVIYLTLWLFDFVPAIILVAGHLVLVKMQAESSAPYTRAFEQYQGAHLTVVFSGSRVSTEQVLTTARLPEVTASAGPWETAQAPVEFGGQKTVVRIIARPDPGGPVDRLTLSAGRWVTQAGEIVLTHSFAQSIGARVGSHLSALSSADRPDLVVVGEVVDIDEGSASPYNVQDAWVQPAQFSDLLLVGQQPDAIMLYRFRHAGSDATCGRAAGRSRRSRHQAR
ncbi:MAG TPA: hypothetical protein VF808_16695, partial [Ktedonobacterales bacterium]